MFYNTNNKTCFKNLYILKFHSDSDLLIGLTDIVTNREVFLL
jgi:hypothetical protein